MEHDNILKYLGAERKGEGLGLEFWIITEYHPNGSLHEYLKSHTVTWNNLLKIIQGIGLGKFTHSPDSIYLLLLFMLNRFGTST